MRKNRKADDARPSAETKRITQKRGKKEQIKEESETEDEREDEREDENDVIPNEDESEYDSDAASNASDTDEININFGTFQFSNGNYQPTYLAKKRKRPKLPQLLKQAESQKQLLEELKNSQEKEELKNQAYNKMFKQAQGIKVRDDPKLIKRSIKRQKIKRKKSAIQWKERKDAEAQQQKNRQKQRAENIRKHLEMKRDKKKGKKVTKRPGFEGRKKKFLNK